MPRIASQDQSASSRTAHTVVRVLAMALALGLLIAALPGPVAAARGARIEPKVVIIVGPSGEATSGYLALAEEGARAARRYTSNVVTLYTPNATWPRVRTALDGASIVAYLGHGNGWPSRYRAAPWPYSQNGFGLDPAGGADGEEHQYFGEHYLARDVRLARGAVVMLSHLCYASGNSEPGLPEGGLEVARQRVDNYAAGFIAAGASAVVAEGRVGPGYYIEALLAGSDRIADIWEDSPSYKGNVMEFESQRSPGHTAYLDPDSRGAGFYRSLVLGRNAGRLAGPAYGHEIDTRSDGDSGSEGGGSDALGVLDADGPPVTFGQPLLRGAPAAGNTVRLRLPITEGAERLPADLTLNVRWDPLLLEGPGLARMESGMLPLRPVETEDEVLLTDGSSTGTSGTTGTTGSTGTEPAWIVSERLGDVVQTEIAKVGRRAIRANLLVPEARGLYRLTIMPADTDAEPLAPERAVAVLPQIVRVTGQLGVTYVTPAGLQSIAGQPVHVPVKLVNTGAADWLATPPGIEPASLRLVARWIPLGLEAASPAPVHVDVAPVAPAQATDLSLDLIAPAAGGQYLLMLDLLLPDGTSLAAKGAAPHLVPVSVQAPVAARDAETPAGTVPAPDSLETSDGTNDASRGQTATPSAYGWTAPTRYR